MTTVRRIATTLTAGLALALLGAAPASASSWVYHSSYQDDVIFDFTCGEVGQELVASGAVQDSKCLLNASTGLWDLYTITGTWTYRATYQDFFACAGAGGNLVSSGAVQTAKCDPAGGGRAALYTIS